VQYWTANQFAVDVAVLKSSKDDSGEKVFVFADAIADISADLRKLHE
jgi:hypothetical protein